MLSMTKRADYALLALSYLAGSSADDPMRLVNTREVAEQFDIPQELLAKLLQTLAKGGLIASHPGPTGGYRLLKRPEAISIGQVLELVDGPLALLGCSNGQGDTCKQFSRCTVRDPLAEIEGRVKSLLHAMTLAEIALPEPRPVFEDFSHRTFASALPVG